MKTVNLSDNKGRIGTKWLLLSPFQPSGTLNLKLYTSQYTKTFIFWVWKDYYEIEKQKMKC